MNRIKNISFISVFAKMELPKNQIVELCQRYSEQLFSIFKDKKFLSKTQIIFQMAFLYSLIYSSYRVLLTIFFAFLSYSISSIFTIYFKENEKITRFFITIIVPSSIILFIMGFWYLLLILFCIDIANALEGNEPIISRGSDIIVSKLITHLGKL